ncbi:DUF2752 domain-containing protein [Paenimyroides aestuarii]|uniref:DUF2752 domain-containing protein n=1 Tax=Paenimyroides aestuarii TaxID=2968490 RepID=A0ABY5NQS1_9FLAO|nr:DUF2752 domain-containing protein [Paenimyroides aestuarii]UUV20787.1 DUF2752 domain-containing protein [Paenimyroides aestuarii]
MPRIKKNTFYFLLLIACIAGYIWLFYNIKTVSNTHAEVTVCSIKRITTFPCPSCGSTRAVIALMNGDIQKALLLNPLGIIIAIIMLVLPIWLLFDLFFNKTTFLKFYKDTEQFLQKPKIAWTAVLLLLLNWIWNIIKDV